MMKRYNTTGDYHFPLEEDENGEFVEYDDVEPLINFVRYIANDWVELSHDKVRLQRDDYIKKARELLKED